MGAVWAMDSYEVFDGAFRRQYGVKPKGQLSRQNPRFERVAPFHEMVICSPDTITNRIGQQWVRNANLIVSAMPSFLHEASILRSANAADN